MSTLIPPELSIRSEFLPSLDRIKRIAANKTINEPPHSLSKTLIIAINFQDGVLILSDKRVVDWGFQLASDKCQKISMVSPFSIMGASGAAGMCNFFIESMKKMNATFLRQYENWLSPEGQARYLKNFIEAITEEIDIFHYAIPLLVAYDRVHGRGRIFYFEPESSLAAYTMEEEEFCGIGCGYQQIKGFLLANYKKAYPLTINSALEIGIKAYALAGKLSIGVTDLRIELPHIAIVTEKQARFIKRKEMIPYINKAFRIILDIGAGEPENPFDFNEVGS